MNDIKQYSDVTFCESDYDSTHNDIINANTDDEDIIHNKREASEPKCVTPNGIKNKYRFIRELGSGAQSKVFLAKRLSDGKLTAIKQLRIDSIKTWKEYTLFHCEAEVLSKLQIPGVVKLYEAQDCLDDNPPCSYIVQEYIEGPTLKTVLASGYRFSLNQIYTLILQLLDILQSLHHHEPQVIHRDIKPSNIILRNWDNGRFEACLIDFGAVANPQVQSGGSTIAGTFGYMSPEQLIGRAVPASDTYAIAALIAYLLSGTDPSEMTIKDLRLIIDPYVESQPRALVQTLRQMLEPSLDKRLADLDELKARFKAFAEGSYTFAEDDKKLSDTYIEQLKSVHHLCQAQNINLWQQLPNDTNKRPALDELFITNPRFKDYPILPTSDSGNEYKAKLEQADHSSVSVSLCLSLLCGGLTAIASGIRYIGDAIFWGIVVAIFTYIYTRVLTLFFIAMKLSSKRPSNKCILQDHHHDDAQPCYPHRAIYQKGIKAIATITDIQFISPEPKDINDISDSKRLRIEVPPNFKIIYKFNPPDDDTPQDLYHTIITHVDPAGLFKVGDPLPILYEQSRDQHVISSMPFPLPFSDLNDSSDYIYNDLLPDEI